MKAYDVMTVDAVGMPFTGSTPELQGLGGSEWEQILLLEELARRGYRVAAMNRVSAWSRVNGVDYLPLGMVEYDVPPAERVIFMRNTPHQRRPDWHRHARWITDNAPDEETGPLEVVCVSDWQAKTCRPLEQSEVIHNMLPDWVYDLPHTRNTPAQSFIYASAAMKGLRETLAYFAQMKATKEYRNATLTVCSPGYDRPDKIEQPGVTWKGALPFAALVEEMQQHRSLLHVSTCPETFGIAHVLAETLGLNVFVLRTAGPDALSEVLVSPVYDNIGHFNAALTTHGDYPQQWKPFTAKEYRQSRIVDEWCRVLGLERVAQHVKEQAQAYT